MGALKQGKELAQPRSDAPRTEPGDTGLVLYVQGVSNMAGKHVCFTTLYSCYARV